MYFYFIIIIFFTHCSSKGSYLYNSTTKPKHRQTEILEFLRTYVLSYINHLG